MISSREARCRLLLLILIAVSCADRTDVLDPDQHAAQLAKDVATPSEDTRDGDVDDDDVLVPAADSVDSGPGDVTKVDVEPGDAQECPDGGACGGCDPETSCNGNGICSPSGECVCSVGYGGASCVDVNECDENTDECDVNAICENLPGSYECTCNDGFTGTGIGSGTIGAPPGLGTLRYLQTFEEGVGGWFSKACGTTECSDDAPVLTFDATAPSPWRVQKVDRAELGGHYYSPYIPIVTGKTYCLSAWVRWESGGWPFIGLDRWTSEHQFLMEHWLIGQAGTSDSAGGVVTPIPADTKEWHWYAKTFVLPDGGSQVRLKTEFYAGTFKAGDTLGYIDDIALFDGPCPAAPPDFVAGTCLPTE